MLTPLLYSLYTHGRSATSDNNIIKKFADNTAVVGLISNDSERLYTREICHLEDWCQLNNLQLNISKTKKLIMDFSRKQQRSYTLVDQQDTGWEGGQIQVPQGQHLRGSDMD